MLTQTRYTDSVDFFSLFEADTFSMEMLDDTTGNWEGYIGVGGELVQAAGFDASTGEGWYDDTLI
jgi:hypothetical protein